MIDDGHIPFFCDGEQHQLFPGIDLNCFEACDETCPDDCCDKVSCCAEEECLTSCDLLCDGYLQCDHPSDCQEAHCNLLNCDVESPPCFDETCFTNTNNHDLHVEPGRKKRKVDHGLPTDVHGAGVEDNFITQTFDFESQQLAFQTHTHEPICFGHTESCQEGCIDPTHLHLQPSLCHHLPNLVNHTNNSVIESHRSIHPHDSIVHNSPREASIASTPYLTHSESRPSTACSIPIEFSDSFYSNTVIQCRCINIDGQMCALTFPDPGSLNQHILDTHISKTKRVDSSSEGFYCCWADCPRHLKSQPFTSIGKIESHYLSHSGHKGWRCEICGNIYAREGSLDRHRQTHLNDKLYKCHFCGKTTTDKNQLKIHVRSHTGEKPYKCDFPGCNHRASDSTNMTKHKKTHQPRTHFCPYPGCNRMFVRSDGLKRHMKTCRAGKEFEKSVDFSHHHHQPQQQFDESTNFDLHIQTTV